MPLSPGLLDRCREVLLICDQFRSTDDLASIFITDELCPLQFDIPFGNSRRQLVNNFLKYILENKTRSGKPAFPVFLATLRDQYKDDRRKQLTELLQDQEILALEGPAPAGSSLSASQQQELYQKLQQELHQKLLDLDFKPQIDQFWDVIDQHRIAAFLVHGPPRHGQQLLTRRLIRFREEWGTGQLIMIDAISNGVGKDPDALWSQVAAQLDLKDKEATQDLADKVCEWWKTQDVIFVVPTVDYIPENVLATWLDKFWKPIAATARQQQGLIRPEKRKHLLLFLIDFSGHVCETQVTLLDQPAEILSSHAPLKLPPTAKIEEMDLKNWIRTAAGLFPRKVDAMALIRDTQNGTPDLLYAKIFEFCGLTWQGVKLP